MPAKKKAKKKNGEKAAKNEMLISKSRVYRLVKEDLKMRISSACFDVISDRVKAMVKVAAEKASGEKRQTLKPRDFEVSGEDE